MPWPEAPPAAARRAAYADAEPRAPWPRPETAAPALEEVTHADLCIVGAGFTGLWAALHAKADDPARDVLVLEAETAGFGASGRNGGFAVASLTHGLDNGLARFADELPALERLSLDNFSGLVADLGRHGIGCDFEPTGQLTALTEPHQLAGLEEEARQLRAFGHEVDLFDGPAMRAEIGSPTYLGGLWDRTGAGILDPGKLAVGLRDAALRLGVRLYERSPWKRSATATCSRRAAACARGASCSPRAPTRRCCGRSAATSSRSTTTR